jgi:hypothetical protein
MKTPLENLHSFFSKRQAGKILFFLIAILFCGFNSNAAIESAKNRITGSAVVTNGSVATNDNKLSFMLSHSTTWRNSFNIANAVGRVRVGFNHSSLAYVSTAYSYTFYLKIEYRDSSLGSIATIYRTLTAEYDPNASASYQDAGLYEVNSIGVVYIKATIDSIRNNLTALFVSSVPLNMFLETSTVFERYYVMSYTAIPTLTYFGPATAMHTDSNEVQVFCQHFQGAEQFQIEWTYANDYRANGTSLMDDDSVPYDFVHNSTRVTTTQHNSHNHTEGYSIPLIFDKGWLLFRVRAVGKAYDSVSGEWKNVYSRWSSDFSSGDADTVGSYTLIYRYHIITSHDSIKN